MNDQEINTLIAEAYGWTRHSVTKEDPFHCIKCGATYARTIWREWEIPYLWCEKDGKDRIPDYCRDLNAMHEAEKFLETDDFELLDNYIFWLNEVIQRNHRIDCLVRATARQKAEAFLKAIGKWKEGE